MLCWQFNDHMDILINQRLEFYLNNTINLCPLCPQIMPSYTHKMANGDRIVAIDNCDVTSPYVYGLRIILVSPFLLIHGILWDV